MLVLTRKAGQSIVIKTDTGDEIEILVLNISGNQVKIGTEASNKYKILRNELMDKPL